MHDLALRIALYSAPKTKPPRSSGAVFYLTIPRLAVGGHKGSAIAATYRAAGAAGHLDQALAGVEVAERDAEGICRIRLRGG